MTQGIHYLPAYRTNEPMKVNVFFLILAVVIAPGCAATEEEAWNPWCDFRGYCRLKLSVQVQSKPDGAQVYLGEELMGVTPCTVVVEAAPVITGQKQIITSPVDGSRHYFIRDSSYRGQTSYTIWVAKDGYEPLSHTIVMEEMFPAEALLHDKLYEKSVTMIFELEERRSPPP